MYKLSCLLIRAIHNLIISNFRVEVPMEQLTYPDLVLKEENDVDVPLPTDQVSIQNISSKTFKTTFEFDVFINKYNYLFIYYTIA